MSSKVRTRVGLLALALAALVALLGAGASAAQAAGSAFCEQAYEGDLHRACVATEKYWDSTVAIRDGFVESSACGSSGAGTIGIQYTNPAHASDLSPQLDRPQSLIYVPESLGHARRLVAVEYSVPVLEKGQPPPKPLFGREFDGPTPDRNGLPQYRLRVWLFAANPSGLFADANPRDACGAEELVAPEARVDDCHEVLGDFSVPVERVRKEGGIPPEITLRGENEDEEGGTAMVRVGTFDCTITLAGTAEPTATKFTLLDASVLAPDWAGEDLPGSSRYFLRWVADNRDLAKAFRQGTGVGPDVFAHRRDGLDLEFYPIIGLTGDYQFSSPDFVLRATVGDPTVGDPAGFPTSIRMWHKGPQGMARFHTRLVGTRIAPAVVKVAPRPGTLLAKLIGCDPGPKPDECKEVPADQQGLAAGFSTAATWTAERDWWNPRHDLSGADTGGL